jgi:hypothetical protein
MAKPPPEPKAKHRRKRSKKWCKPGVPHIPVMDNRSNTFTCKRVDPEAYGGIFAHLGYNHWWCFHYYYYCSRCGIRLHRVDDRDCPDYTDP